MTDRTEKQVSSNLSVLTVAVAGLAMAGCVSAPQAIQTQPNAPKTAPPVRTLAPTTSPVRPSVPLGFVVCPHCGQVVPMGEAITTKPGNGYGRYSGIFSHTHTTEADSGNLVPELRPSLPSKE